MKRDSYVDIVKGMCIILVVFVHINILTNRFTIVNNYINNFIYQFFLSVFFIISGFYLKNLSNTKMFFKTKIKKWYIKLLIYYIPFVLLHNLFVKLGVYEVGKIYGSKVTEMYTIKTTIIKIVETILLMGREPLLGAMWFFISQIISLIGLTIISCIVDKICEKIKFDNNKVMFSILLILLFISTSMTELLSLTIPRLSISISAMLLIYIGYYLKQIMKLEYNNKFVFFISIVVLICNTFFVDRIRLNQNIIVNPVTFIISAVCGLYMLCFIGKKIENNILGDIFGMCGKYSFQIMALHLLSFKLAILMINIFKIENVTVLSDLQPITSNICGFAIYMVTGIVLPIIVTKLTYGIKNKIIDIKK